MNTFKKSSEILIIICSSFLFIEGGVWRGEKTCQCYILTVLQLKIKIFYQAFFLLLFSPTIKLPFEVGYAQLSWWYFKIVFHFLLYIICLVLFFSFSSVTLLPTFRDMMNFRLIKFWKFGLTKGLVLHTIFCML